MVIGLDEVGRGSLAGPVVVGAYATSSSVSICGQLRADLERTLGFALADSKKVTARRRAAVFALLRDNPDWSVGLATPAEIDTFGINRAITLAAGRALDTLLASHYEAPERIIADAGLFHPYEERFETERHIRADEQFLPVMLASIMAKVWRDARMAVNGVSFPQYGWEHNAGYGTATHCEAIRTYGLTPEHRRSFCATLGAQKP